MTGSLSTPRPFDLAEPLPRGRVVLDASAGTGKTYTIAGLVARYVAEGVAELPQLLVVTFTRAAAAELRDRVRSRLVTAAAALEAVLAGGSREHDDVAVATIADADADEVRRRHTRVVSALADFDAATITTIHGFAQRVLAGLGLVADVDTDAELAEDTTELLEEVVDDVLVARFADGAAAPVTRSVLLELAGRVVRNPDADVVPDPAVADGEARLRAELVAAVHARFAERKRQRRVLSYDDLLTRLRDALTDPGNGDAAVDVLRSQYRVALVDEFQDTDPVQWDILGRAFDDRQATLVLIGDPKQAIYAFRGADVYAYLEAVGTASSRRTLPISWRSDGDLLTALNAMFEGVTYGHPGIVHHAVGPAPGHDSSRFDVPEARPPLRIRCLRRDQGIREKLGDIKVPAARNQIAADVTREIVTLLDAGARVVERDRDGARVSERDLSCRDIAVLVRTNAEADLIQRCLLDAGIPAIINGVGSVLSTPAATEWERLLEALEQPAAVARARTVALTCFLGWSADDLANASDEDLVPVHELLHAWAALLRDHGVASLLRAVTVSQRLPQRVLARPDGERFLTDLQHVGELLHAAARAEQLGPSALAAWLRARKAEASDEAVPPDERARRLESDDEAVQILTVHRSKGLEFPVVLCPFLSLPGLKWTSVPVFHRPDDGRRTVDVGGKGRWDEFETNHELAMTEYRGELLRLLYVAVTRARHHVVLWWAPVQDAGLSGLGRVLFGRRDDTEVDTTSRAPITNDGRLRDRLEELARRAGGTLAIEDAPERVGPVRWTPPAGATEQLAAAAFGRPVDQEWRRTSYTRLVERAGEQVTTGDGGARGTDRETGAADPGVAEDPVASEPGERVIDDEAMPPDAVLAAGPPSASPTLGDHALRELTLPLAEVGAGRSFGTFVHAVLEEADFAADDLPAELARAIDAARGVAPPAVDLEAVNRGLVHALDTPLGPLAGGGRLRDVTRADRLDELDFELPLAGGDAAGRHGTSSGLVTVDAIGGLLRQHLPAADPLARYVDHLDDPAFGRRVHGFLTGSIDLVLRVRSDPGTSRYLVADYKTNRLGVPGTPLSAWDYRPEALAAAMIHGHYPLQALLYQVALHRYLRWRQPGYDPAAHLGGVLYLFLRGMAGPAGVIRQGVASGVFGWVPPVSLVLALSDLLDGGAR